MRKKLAFLALVAFMAAPLYAALYHTKAAGLSVTTLAQTVDLGGARNTVTISSASGSAGTVYFELYYCGEFIYDADSTNSIPLIAGQTYRFQFNPNENQTKRGYCYISLVSASTSTVHIIAK